MTEEIKLNKLITDKIENLEIDKNIKDFLKDIIIFEKSISNLGGKPSYKDEYKQKIMKYSSKEE